MPDQFKFSDGELAVPQLAITVGGKTEYETGYGKRIIADSSGSKLVILDVEPVESSTRRS